MVDPNIILATYEYLIEVVKNKGEVKMRNLWVSKEHKDNVKDMFSQYHNAPVKLFW